MNRTQRRLHSYRRRSAVRTISLSGLLSDGGKDARVSPGLVGAAFPVSTGDFSATVELPRRPRGWIVHEQNALDVDLPADFGRVSVAPGRGPGGLAAAAVWLRSRPELRSLPVAVMGTGPGSGVAIEAGTIAGETVDTVVVDHIPDGSPVVLTPILVTGDSGSQCSDTSELSSLLGSALDLPPAPALNHDQRRRLARGIERGLRQDHRKAGGLGRAARAALATLATAVAFAFASGLGAGTASAAVTTQFTPFTGGTGYLLVSSDGASDGVTVDCDASLVRVNGSYVSGPLFCTGIRGLTVTGAGGADEIDLSGVTNGDTLAVNNNFSLLSDQGISVDGGSGQDTLIGPDHTTGSTMSGGPGEDSVQGSPAADLFAGDHGDDDTIVGGTGSDTIDYSDASTGIGIDFSTNKTSGGAGVDALLQIQNAVGSAFDDLIEADSPTGVFVGGNGNDTILGPTLAPTTISGGDGNDSLVARSTNPSHDNLIQGEDDNDTVSGTGGPDTLNGGLGNDVLGSDAAAGESLVGGDGEDTVDFGSASAGVNLNIGNFSSAGMTLSGLGHVTGSPFPDTLTGTSAANVLRGGGGADSLVPLNGDDTLMGDGGNDTLSGAGSGSKLLEGGADDDRLVASGVAGAIQTLDGGNGSDTLIATSTQDNSLVGGGGADEISAVSNSGVNTVFGGLMDDTVLAGSGGGYYGGDAGNDLITGSDAKNTLDGGADDDTIVNGDGGEELLGGPGTGDMLVQTGVTGDQVLTDDSVTGKGGDDASGFESASLTGSSGLIDASGFSGGPVTLVGTFASNQTLVGSPAADSLDGGGGTGDQIRNLASASQTLSPASLVTGAVTDTLAGFDGASLRSGAGNDVIDSSAFDGPVTLDGQGGDDTIVPGATGNNNDSLIGGPGTDSLQVAATGSDTLIELGPTLLTGSGFSGIGSDTISGFEGSSISAVVESMPRSSAGSSPWWVGPPWSSPAAQVSITPFREVPGPTTCSCANHTRARI